MFNPGTTSRTGFDPILVTPRPQMSRAHTSRDGAVPKRSWKRPAVFAELSGAAVVAIALGGFMFVKTPRVAEGETNTRETAVAAATAYRPAASNTPDIVPDDARDVVQDQADRPGRLTGKAAVKRVVETLANGIDQFEQVPGYQAKFFKQERIDGALSDDEEIDLKLAHTPFRVYMKWRSGEVGQQALYIDGEYDNQVLVQPGGLKGRLAGTLKMDPRDERAMACSRYPITNLGMVELARLIQAVLVKDLETNAAMTCQLVDEGTYEGRPCSHFTATYQTPQPGHPYRKVELCLDKEFEMPVLARTHGWDENGSPAPDEDTLLECYRYHEIAVYDEVPEKDFDPKNRKYALRLK
ncbi:hypothetical protein VT03_15490 [Planctomyces sp. SH-PL14]|nr:hypothetical protein VT03_15490 [Planctomyces sp. SH-PL14]